jgi:TRAP-type C4-dicarboxylate transport system substrate-binding protein
VEIFDVSGGVPVALSVPEAYNALERGVVDGTILPYEALHAFKLAEVTKHHVDVRMYTASQFTIMNLAKYNALPADLKKVLDDLGGNWAAEFAGAAWDKAEEPGIEAAKKLGNKFYTLTPEQRAAWREKAKPVAQAWVASMEAKGLPGKQALSDLTELLKRHDP